MADLLKPEWMHKNEKVLSPLLQFKVAAPYPSLRNGSNIYHLMDKDQPSKSIFSYMDFRHNVHSKQEAVKYGEVTKTQIKRPYEWNTDMVTNTNKKYFGN